jgi:hypothetical protein
LLKLVKCLLLEIPKSKLKSHKIKLVMLLNMDLVYGSDSTLEFQKDLTLILLEIVC